MRAGPPSLRAEQQLLLLACPLRIAAGNGRGKQAHRHRQAADDAHVKGREGRQAPPPPGCSTNETAPCYGSRRSSDLAPSFEISRVCCSSTSSARVVVCYSRDLPRERVRVNTTARSGGRVATLPVPLPWARGCFRPLSLFFRGGGRPI